MKGMLEKKYRVISIVILITLILLSFFQQWFIMNPNEKISILSAKYYLMTIIWCVFIICILIFIPKIHIICKLKYKDKVYFDALVGAIIYIVCRYIIGIIIFNLGKSTYDLSPKGMLINTANIVTPMIAREIARSYIFNTFFRKNMTSAFFILSIALAVTDLNFNSIAGIKDLEGLTKFVSQSVGPAISQSILLSYMVIHGGALSSIIFVCFVFAFQWFIPVLPDLNWFAEGILGIIVPIYEIPLLFNKYKTKRFKTKNKTVSLKEIISTSITMSFSVLLIWFVAGVFPVFPSVIATGSMEPMIDPGDIILIDKIEKEEDVFNLKEGDIIHFKRDDIYITHRIVEVLKDKNGNISFRTKGDNNSREDSRIVLPNDIKGTLVTVVPKLGYPTLWLKSKSETGRNDIEF